jgi:hypothetical protein
MSRFVILQGLAGSLVGGVVSLAEVIGDECQQRFDASGPVK